MRELHKRILSVVVTMLLLPYILTLFISGQDVSVKTQESTQKIIIIEEDNKVFKITEEEYIIGILAKEIPIEYELEAMKSQAVIIRTRIYKESSLDENYIHTDAYFTYEDIIKKWSGSEVTEIYTQLKQAVESTSGQVAIMGGELVMTPYHLQNAGQTRSGENGLGVDYSHLKSVECSLDVTGLNASSKTIIKYIDLAEKIGIEGTLDFDDINILATADDGYVSELSIGEKVITGEQFRQLYQLNSTVLSLQEGDESHFQVTTRGSGHGIGLSQNTANYMALEGKTYKDILQYFYSGIEVENITEVIGNTVVIEEIEEKNN